MIIAHHQPLKHFASYAFFDAGTEKYKPLKEIRCLLFKEIRCLLFKALNIIFVTMMSLYSKRKARLVPCENHKRFKRFSNDFLVSPDNIFSVNVLQILWLTLGIAEDIFILHLDP